MALILNMPIRLLKARSGNSVNEKVGLIQISGLLGSDLIFAKDAAIEHQKDFQLSRKMDVRTPIKLFFP